jgi:hypothetical protein
MKDGCHVIASFLFLCNLVEMFKSTFYLVKRLLYLCCCRDIVLTDVGIAMLLLIGPGRYPKVVVG